MHIHQAINVFSAQLDEHCGNNHLICILHSTAIQKKKKAPAHAQPATPAPRGRLGPGPNPVPLPRGGWSRPSLAPFRAGGAGGTAAPRSRTGPGPAACLEPIECCDARGRGWGWRLRPLWPHPIWLRLDSDHALLGSSSLFWPRPDRLRPFGPAPPGATHSRGCAAPGAGRAGERALTRAVLTHACSHMFTRVHTCSHVFTRAQVHTHPRPPSTHACKAGARGRAPGHPAHAAVSVHQAGGVARRPGGGTDRRTGGWTDGQEDGGVNSQMDGQTDG